MYRRIKSRESADGVVCLDLERSVLRIASGYKKGHGFCETLENASPTCSHFSNIRACSPHNNAVELEIRDMVMLHRNVRHHLSEPEGYHVFPVLVSVARTCKKVGMFQRMAVERMIEDSDWHIFEPPDYPGRAERSVQAAATAPSVVAATVTTVVC